MLTVDVDMRLHAEVLFVAHIAPGNPRVAHAAAAFRRARRARDSGIDERASADLDARINEVGVDRGKDLPARMMGLEKEARYADNCLVGHWPTAEVDADRFAKSLRVVRRFPNRWVGGREPALQALNARYLLQSHRRSDCAVVRRARQCSQFEQRPSRHRRVHLANDLLALRALSVTLEPARRRCLLFRSHRLALPAPTSTQCTMPRNKPESPRAFLLCDPMLPP